MQSLAARRGYRVVIAAGVDSLPTLQRVERVMDRGSFQPAELGAESLVVGAHDADIGACEAGTREHFARNHALPSRGRSEGLAENVFRRDTAIGRIAPCIEFCRIASRGTRRAKAEERIARLYRELGAHLLGGLAAGCDGVERARIGDAAQLDPGWRGFAAEVEGGCAASRDGSAGEKAQRVRHQPICLLGAEDQHPVTLLIGKQACAESQAFQEGGVVTDQGVICESRV